MTLGVSLPDAYREALRDLADDPADGLSGLFDDPDAVIDHTQAPMSEGNYDGTNWRPSYVAIGDSGAGDLYVLDTARIPAPVLVLSHEDHAITEESPSLTVFVAAWRRWLGEDWARRRAEAEAATERSRHRRRFLFALFGLLFLFPLTVALMDGAGRLGVPRHGAGLLVSLALIAFAVLVRVMVGAIRRGIHY